jgi:hypothetical protein
VLRGSTVPERRRPAAPDDERELGVRVRGWRSCHLQDPHACMAALLAIGFRVGVLDRLEAADTIRKTLIYWSIIYGASCLDAPRISICGAPRNMRHMFCFMCDVPNKRCGTHMWALTGTTIGVSGPHIRGA